MNAGGCRIATSFIFLDASKIFLRFMHASVSGKFFKIRFAPYMQIFYAAISTLFPRAFSRSNSFAPLLTVVRIVVVVSPPAV